jgi:hypothetical protein
MTRFKHTGERLRQLQAESLPGTRDRITEQAERDKGRSLTAAELREVEKAARTIADLPVYGG